MQVARRFEGIVAVALRRSQKGLQPQMNGDERG